MNGMTIKSAAEASCGVLSCESGCDAVLGKVVIDSRAVEPGDFFVAFKGERADGNDYITAAFDRGAVCCLAQRAPEGETRPVIVVLDVQDALESICAAYRSTLNIPVIGITGSVGKTSVKEMIAAVLSRRFAVLKTDKNMNNQIGVPMTLSRIAPTDEAAVVEMGISDFGEMSRLAQMVRPTVAVFTVIGHAHLEFLRDPDGVLEAKTEMLDYMPRDGLVVVNGDDERLARLKCAQRIISVGLGENCDIRAEELRLDALGNIDCVLTYGERRVSVHIPAFGRHMVYAALEGAAVGFALGLSDGEIQAGIADYKTVGRRAALTDTGYLTLVDDSYNANPDSMLSGIDSLMSLPGRHVCILGDMLELGEKSPEMHYETGRYAAARGADAVLTCGELAAETSRGAGSAGTHFPDRAALIAALPERIHRGDAVLVKASRGSCFEEVADALKRL